MRININLGMVQALFGLVFSEANAVCAACAGLAISILPFWNLRSHLLFLSPAEVRMPAAVNMHVAADIVAVDPVSLNCYYRIIHRNAFQEQAISSNA